MLQKEEVEQLLIEAFSAEMLILGDISSLYRGKLTHKLSVRSYAKSKTENAYVSIETDENIYPAAIEKMAHISGVCVQDEKDHLILLVGSGVWKMNPAVVEMCFYDTHLEVAAWAKEKLINQHTAEKAIQICLTALGLA
ncbi:MAG: hypothetical protein IKB79_05265 [Oscillospiraceae bacterium]|nr:hypothetical protein [Oscillospiraceae bacterium]